MRLPPPLRKKPITCSMLNAPENSADCIPTHTHIHTHTQAMNNIRDTFHPGCGTEGDTIEDGRAAMRTRPRGGATYGILGALELFVLRALIHTHGDELHTV